MASRLDGSAFERYARMSEEHQKDPAVVAEELKQEFVKAERDRDTAIHEPTDDLGSQVSLQLHLHIMFAALLNWHIPDLARMRSMP